MGAAPASAAGAGGDPPKPAVALPFLVSSTLPVKECQLTVATDPTPHPPTTLAEVIERKPFVVWVSSGVILAVAVLVTVLALIVAHAARKMRQMRLNNDLAKLTLREMGATGASSAALLRAHCELILVVQSNAKHLPDEAARAAQELVKGCKTFLKAV
jgi:thiamine pyrophosphate-dependent acetolactate synthase large subunit-like protein